MKEKRSTKELTKRYLFFLSGLFVNAFGVSFITKASLGTSPISSIPYVLSLAFTPTMGMFTFLFNILLITGEILMLRKSFNKIQLLQIPVTLLFSYFIDLTMSLLSSLVPETYILKILSLLAGCVILAFGVWIEVVADVVMLPGEAFVSALATMIKKEFGTIKVCFDTTLMLCSCVIALILFHRLEGVREGTVVSAILVGMIVKVYNKKFCFVRIHLTDKKDEVTEGYAATENNNTIITISREYGSGGREVGEKLAKKLGIAFYDKDIIALTAKESGYKDEYVEKNEQKITNSLLYDLVTQGYSYSSDELAPLDALFLAESKIIKELAAKGPCIIVGRCADHILRENDNGFHIFVRSAMNQRVNRIKEKCKVSEDKAKLDIMKNDKVRSNHYKRYTGHNWKDVNNYNLMVDTGKFGIDGSVAFIEDALKRII